MTENAAGNTPENTSLSATESGPAKSERSWPAVAVRVGLPFTLFMLAILTYVVITARAFPTEQAKLFPLAIGIPALGMTLVQLVTDLRAIAKGGGAQADILDLGGDDDETLSSRHAPTIAWAWFLGFVILTYVVGFSISILVFTPFYLWRVAKAKPFAAILGGAALWGVVIGVLHYGLLLDVPAGLVFGG